MIEFKLNGNIVKASEGETVLEVAIREGVYIPTLCHHEAVKSTGACRMCLVEAKEEGRKRGKIVTSCTFPAKNGLEVTTDTETIVSDRKTVLDLLKARAPESQELKEMSVKLGYSEDTPFDPVEDSGDCILCGLCTRVCDEVVGAKAITFNGRGGNTSVGGPLMTTPEACIGCGACVYVCPVDCIKMVDTAETRTIVKWNRELPMKKCEECGWPFMPNFQILQFTKWTEVPRDFFTKCPDCRR